MGICVSKPAVGYQLDEEGYLERVTVVNPTRAERQFANQQRRMMIEQIGKRNYNNLVPVAETVVTNIRG